ncbi:MAG: helix-turn-helix domain-containing protein [Bryobacteraceae bacterium]
MENPERLLKPEEAAKLLGIGMSTLAKFRIEGAGPIFRKFGRSVRYARADLQRWADDRSRQSTSESRAAS